jgi:hypothetical protein
MDDDDSPFLLSVDELGLTGLWASVREVGLLNQLMAQTWF